MASVDDWHKVIQVSRSSGNKAQKLLAHWDTGIYFIAPWHTVGALLSSLYSACHRNSLCSLKLAPNISSITFAVNCKTPIWSLRIICPVYSCFCSLLDQSSSDLEYLPTSLCLIGVQGQLESSSWSCTRCLYLSQRPFGHKQWPRELSSFLCTSNI